MNDEPNVMRLLVEARPIHFDRPADPRRREDDLAHIFAQPSKTVDRFPPPNAGTRQASSSSRPSLRHISDPTRSSTRCRVVALTAAAGVTAVALIALGAVTGSEPVRNDSTASTGTPEPGQSQALLLAAEHVSTAPDTGKYWRTTTESRDLELGSTAKGSFRLYYSEADETWVARSSRDPSRAVSRPWSRVPANSEDRADWQRAGSPTTFDLHDVDRNGKPDIMTDVSSTSGKGTVVDPMNTNSDVFFIGGLGKSMSDIRRLPAEPKTLTTALLENYQRSIDAAAKHGRGRPENNNEAKQQWLFNAATEVLMLPVTSQVRATAYRIMAGLDGIENLGQARDVKGRIGDAVALRSNSSRGLQEDRLIIEATTGLPLAQETRLLNPIAAMSWVNPTDIYSTSIITHIGWTNDNPPARTKYEPSGDSVG